VTSSDNAEQWGSTDAAASGDLDSGTPPWQRVAEDSAEQTTVTGTAVNHSAFGHQEVSDSAGTAGEQSGGQKRGGGMNLGEVAGAGRDAPSALRRPGRGPRRASLQVKRFDPWSVLNLSLVFGVTLFVIWIVAVGVLYFALDGMGVWDQLNGAYSSLLEGDDAGDGGEPLITAPRVFFFAAVVGAINLVLLAALATIGSFIYNVSADLAGGLEVTLSERE